MIDWKDEETGFFPETSEMIENAVPSDGKDKNRVKPGGGVIRLRGAEPVIDKDNPFAGDLLEREQCAVVLGQMLLNLGGRSVICVNSPWGSGKTAFIKMFRQYLFNLGVPSVYFNVWESDFDDNPIIAFIAEIGSAIDELKKQGFETERARKTFKKIRRTGKDLLRKSIPVAVKIASHGTVDMDKGIDDTFSDFTSGVIEEQIKNYSGSREQVRRFRELLSELAAELQKNHSGTMPLVFFIDDIDRCRSGYVVHLLEKVRHLLDADGVIPVLSMDIEQAGQSVKNVFGQNIRERSYLRKFIDLEYNLPYDNYTSELYCRALSAGSEFAVLAAKSDDAELFISELKYSGFLMASSFSLSLSDLSALYNNLHLVLLGYEKPGVPAVPVLMILLTLKIRNTKLFSQVVNIERSVFYLINELNKTKRMSITVKEFDRFFIERRLAPLCLKIISDDEFQKQLQPSSVPGSNELNGIYKLIKDKSRSNDRDLFTETLLKKVKLLDQFKI